MKKLLNFILILSFYAVAQEDDADIPPEILQLEDSFESAPPPDEVKAVPENPKELSQGVPVPKASEPGEDLPPSMMLYRVPLFPALSEANWKKYMGPDVTRIYNTKRGDSLWIISERLFGNPHLWPKIWQLNANVANPHTIQRGLELSFTPGNPNASPHLAFIKRANSSDTFLPALTGHVRDITVSDKIREALTEADNGFNRFRSFLIRNKPEILGKIPEKMRASYNILFQTGDHFALPNVPAGDYAIIRLRDPVAKDLGGQVLWWVGNISVKDSEGPEESFVKRAPIK